MRRPYLPLGAAALTVALVLPVPSAQALPGFTVTRLADTSDRFATAASVAREAFPDGAPEVLVVNGDNPVDALGAAGFAGPDIPILYVHRDSVPAATAELVAEFDPDLVYIAGGPGAVSQQVADTLGAGRGVFRFSGADRYETAATFAVATAEDTGATRVVLARGDVYADALAATAWAAKDGIPIVLTTPGELPGTTRWALEEIGGAVTIIGGPLAVSTGIEQSLWNTGISTDRLGGRNRYQTAEFIAGDARTGFGNPTTVGIANGVSLVDSLPAAVLLAQSRSPLLLSSPTELTEHTATYLNKKWEYLTDAVVFGGTGAVPDVVVAQARDAATTGAAGLSIERTTDTSVMFTMWQYQGVEARYVLQIAPARYDGGAYVPAPLTPPADAVTLPTTDATDQISGVQYLAAGLTPDTAYDVWATRALPGLPPVQYRWTVQNGGTRLQNTAEPLPLGPSVRTRTAPLQLQDVVRSADGTAFTVTLPALPAGSNYGFNWCQARTDENGTYVPPTSASGDGTAGGNCAVGPESGSRLVDEAGTSSFTATDLDPTRPYEVWVSTTNFRDTPWVAYWNSAVGASQVTAQPLPTAPSLPVG